MLGKIFVILSAWFLLSLIVGLLAGRVMSTFPETPAPGYVPPLETDWETAALKELGEEALPFLAHAHTK